MDPFTISSIVVKLTATGLSTGKSLYDIRTKYKDAPLSISTICSETTIITACIARIQSVILSKEDFVQLLDSRPELALTLDAALTGCMVVFSCIDEEIRKITDKYSRADVLSGKGKARAVWNHDRLRDLLDGLRGQQGAINFLIQLVQLDSLGDIKQILSENRPVLTESIHKTESLKQSNPNVHFPESIYTADDRQSIYGSASLVTGTSELEFEFDDMFVNSRVYRRVLASAKKKLTEPNLESIEGDLIDLSDNQTIVQAHVTETARDLQSLVVTPLDPSPEKEEEDFDRVIYLPVEPVIGNKIEFPLKRIVQIQLQAKKANPSGLWINQHRWKLSQQFR